MNKVAKNFWLMIIDIFCYGLILVITVFSILVVDSLLARINILIMCGVVLYFYLGIVIEDRNNRFDYLFFILSLISFFILIIIVEETLIVVMLAIMVVITAYYNERLE